MKLFFFKKIFYKILGWRFTDDWYDFNINLKLRCRDCGEKLNLTDNDENILSAAENLHVTTAICPSCKSSYSVEIYSWE